MLTSAVPEGKAGLWWAGDIPGKGMLQGAGCGRSKLRHSTVMRRAGRVFGNGEPHGSGGDKCRREDQLSRRKIKNKEQWELCGIRHSQVRQMPGWGAELR